MKFPDQRHSLLGVPQTYRLYTQEGIADDLDDHQMGFWDLLSLMNLPATWTRGIFVLSVLGEVGHDIFKDRIACCTELGVPNLIQHVQSRANSLDDLRSLRE